MPRQLKEPQVLTKENLQILSKVTNDVFFFSTFCYVVHPIRGKVHFYLYPLL